MPEVLMKLIPNWGENGMRMENGGKTNALPRQVNG
jgi:hypothetical protein